jgi:hypothetical protein
LPAQWTATVRKNVSNGANDQTILNHWLELAETSPQRAFLNAVETVLVITAPSRQPPNMILWATRRGLYDWQVEATDIPRNQNLGSF